MRSLSHRASALRGNHPPSSRIVAPGRTRQGEVPRRPPSSPSKPPPKPHLNHPAFPQDLFAIFDTIDKAADKVESAPTSPPTSRARLPSPVIRRRHRRSRVVERAAVAAKPIGEAGLRYAERTVGPVANDAASKVTGAAGQAISGVEGFIKAKGIDVEPVAGGRRQGARRRRGLRGLRRARHHRFRRFPLHRVAHRTRRGGGRRGRRVPPRPRFSAFAGGAICGIRGVLARRGVRRGPLRGEHRRRGRQVRARRRARYASVPSPRREQVQVRAPRSSRVTSRTWAKWRRRSPPPRWRPSRAPRAAPRFVFDNNGRGDATKVAKALGAQGFGKVFVVEGGYNGWVNAVLAVAE